MQATSLTLHALHLTVSSHLNDQRAGSCPRSSARLFHPGPKKQGLNWSESSRRRLRIRRSKQSRHTCKQRATGWLAAAAWAQVSESQLGLDARPWICADRFLSRTRRLRRGHALASFSGMGVTSARRDFWRGAAAGCRCGCTSSVCTNSLACAQTPARHGGNNREASHRDIGWWLCHVPLRGKPEWRPDSSDEQVKNNIVNFIPLDYVKESKTCRVGQFD
jgi:hypothetical protein